MADILAGMLDDQSPSPVRTDGPKSAGQVKKSAPKKNPHQKALERLFHKYALISKTTGPVSCKYSATFREMERHPYEQTSPPITDPSLTD